MSANASQRRILLALTEDGYAGTSIESVLHAVRSMTADLHVVRVIDSFVPRHPFFAAIKLRDAGKILRRTREAHRSTCKWAVAAFGDAVLMENVRTETGDLVEQLTQRAADLGAELIILPPSLSDVGIIATSLARSAKVAVLVVRAHVDKGAIFAATDLQDPAFQVLKCAAELAQRFEADVVTFHNVDPLPAVVNTGSSLVPSFALTATVSPTQRAEYLAEASRQLPTVTTPVLRSDIDPVQSILAEAEARHADVVVVGTHYRSWWQRVLSGSVANRVVARAKHSVLVTPIASAPPSGS